MSKELQANNNAWWCVTHPSVRDLVWVMASPSLLASRPDVISDAYCQSMVNQHQQWWLQLERDPAPLTQWLDRHRHKKSRLGVYFEHLIEFWLSQCIAHGYMASHVRLYREKQTLGEMDFLFMTPDQVLHHWETAVKFYLFYQHANGAIGWYGPNANDRLDIKLARLKNHQLCMLRTVQGKAFLETLQSNLRFDAVQSYAFVKGYLFYPLNQWGRHQPWTSPEIAPDHLRGWWCHTADLEFWVNSMANSKQWRWLIVSRTHWLTPQRVDAAQKNNLLQFHELQLRLLDHFRHSRQAVLVTQMTQYDDVAWRECSRGFVVAPVWPEKPPVAKADAVDKLVL